MPDFYIGFTKLEEFISAIDVTRDLNLAPLTFTRHEDYFEHVTAFVIASQVKGDHLIYCKMNVAQWNEMFIGTKMQPFGDRDAERAALAPMLQQQLWEIAVQLIRGHLPDVLIHEGVPSFQNNLTLVDGWPDSATYDKDTQSIVLKQYAAVEHVTV